MSQDTSQWIAFQIRPLALAEKTQAAAFIAQHWGSEIVVAHHTIYRPAELPGFLAIEPDTGRWLGLITYHLAGRACEIVSLDSQREGLGIGGALIEAAKQAAAQAGCERVWLITTNDNLRALRFYQKRAFRLKAVYPGAVEQARQIKPQIPLIGMEGIPLRDEIELEMWLNQE